jgi:hypothetical protein
LARIGRLQSAATEHRLCPLQSTTLARSWKDSCEQQTNIIGTPKNACGWRKSHRTKTRGACCSKWQRLGKASYLLAARRLQPARYEFWTWRLLQSISSDGPSASASWGRSSCIEPHSSCEKQRGDASVRNQGGANVGYRQACQAKAKWTLREWTLIDANKKIDR